ncbi:hypothetical protein [Desulfosporosinus sp. HMP52]|uniref:hypothetical protein n=1 Tax=Desulfosporosinus sp. HMP52 TaxID=1487923 RepID=UPI000A402542|nr:hypothetical protein [Desulfosporosinus sp. HMP52]
MKTYIKPMLENYSLTIEERFAAGSVCSETGCCPDSGIEEYERLTGKKVNYSAGF